MLERGEVITALEKARDAGKTRFIGYSGDNTNALWAVKSGYFDTLQTSFSLVDQRAYTHNLLHETDAAGMGIIIKRPIGNGVWGLKKSPTIYSDDYHNRAHSMKAVGPIAGEPDNAILLAMGFTFAHPQVHTAIVGTTNLDHMLSNIEMMDKGVTPESETMDTLIQRFGELGADWPQMT
mgnify:CR=1 FL=1